ncbi:RHS repeat-associated protein [Parabacteroides sp. PFB2-12]|uniref:RHS repeat-associated core domain-containing protein n=1 Tax=unclassified Parabacteroides TaxID=2649774 RepID=UPI002474AEEB|nr:MULTISPECIES: RHS repeat-associated core domain-containing protein [unclassified Parabacteroides]MDH6344169.1 RHS repeat-associated protein [Parabacteroides sp. PM6-13]MDH6392076.1 RHS repeat-associated protein [Parabacteroides sp. PFB2-12]
MAFTIFANGYERVTESGVTQQLYYLQGGDGLAAIYVKETGKQDQIYYACNDHLGSVTQLVNSAGTPVFQATYDAWGRQSVTTNTFKYHRGYTGHEHLPEFGLVNMNGRLYDPILARFLSPDPYVQMPDYSQGYNRYAYCLNNPLIYTDPSGEFAWFYWAGAALIGGISNLVANWDNVDGFWQGATTFVTGAGAAVGVLATGGSGAAVVIGTGAAGTALVSANNSVVAQTGKNFEGFNKVDWGLVGRHAVIGGVAGAASTSVGYWASTASFTINGIDSPVLRSVVVSPLASGAGHVAGGTTVNLLKNQPLGEAFANSFDGIGQSMAIGTAMGVATTIGVSYASGVNPWTGAKTSIHATQRTNERNIAQKDINDALKNPLKITDVKIQENGASVKYIGREVTVVVNPETGKIITVYRTSTQRVNSILKRVE